jgi:hypothetical protein
LSGNGILKLTQDTTTATNVTITSGGTSKIEIPTGGTLEIGKDATLVLNSFVTTAGATGSLTGTIKVKDGGVIKDENANRGAFKLDTGAQLIVEHGGVGIIKINSGDATGTILVGIKDEENGVKGPTHSDYVQLAEEASFTITEDKYITNGDVTLASTFASSGHEITVGEGLFEVGAGAILYIANDSITGTSANSRIKFTVAPKDLVGAAGKMVIKATANATKASAAPRAGTTYKWNPVDSAWEPTT